MIISSSLPQSVQTLIDEFAKLPGIGPKSAARLTFHLLRANEVKTDSLAHALTDLRARLVYCQNCFNIADSQPCGICADSQRNQQLICVVSEPLDVVALEKTLDFDGVYHVLHGEISPVDGIGPDELKIKQLTDRVKRILLATKPQEIEVILATNPTTEGETTALYLTKLLQPLGIHLTRIARGLPVGGDLEYADQVTLANALANRREYRI